MNKYSITGGEPWGSPLPKVRPEGSVNPIKQWFANRKLNNTTGGIVQMGDNGKYKLDFNWGKLKPWLADNWPKVALTGAAALSPFILHNAVRSGVQQGMQNSNPANPGPAQPMNGREGSVFSSLYS